MFSFSQLRRALTGTHCRWSTWKWFWVTGMVGLSMDWNQSVNSKQRTSPRKKIRVVSLTSQNVWISLLNEENSSSMQKPISTFTTSISYLPLELSGQMKRKLSGTIIAYKMPAPRIPIRLYWPTDDFQWWTITESIKSTCCTRFNNDVIISCLDCQVS